MKKVFAISLCLILAFCTILPLSAEQPSDNEKMGVPMEQLRLGDVNGDGRINATDYVLIKRYITSTEKEGFFDITVIEYDEEGNEIMSGIDAPALADVNKDGVISAVDYVMIKRHILGTYEIPEEYLKVPG